MSGWAIFDVDHTLIEGSTGLELLRAGFRRRMIPLALFLSVPYRYLKYRFGTLDPRRFDASITGLAGVDMKSLRVLAEEVFDSRIRSRIYREALEEMQRERSKGNTLVLATSSVECAVRPLARYLDIEQVVSTRFEVRDGKLTGRFHDPPAFGAEKHRKVERFVAAEGGRLSDCSFYSDSYHDLPLLERVGRPVAVNADPRLTRTAEKRGWERRRYRERLADAKHGKGAKHENGKG
jgi:putative phosphoserine phosphatase/1-acylglycerol-3-phosphate O-acyltransferase